jgi:hypothetical protein
MFLFLFPLFLLHLFLPVFLFFLRVFYILSYFNWFFFIFLLVYLSFFMSQISTIFLAVLLLFFVPSYFYSFSFCVTTANCITCFCCSSLAAGNLWGFIFFKFVYPCVISTPLNPVALRSTPFQPSQIVSLH